MPASRLVRLVRPVALLPAIVLMACGGAGAAQSDPRSYPGDTGSYLAGEQALTDLDTAAAESYLSDAARHGWNSPVLVDRAFTAQAANGDIEEAAQTARHLLDLDPDQDLARLVVATTDLEAGHYDATITELGKLGTDNFTGVTAALLEAWAYTGQNRLDKALGSLQPLAKSGLEDFLNFHEALMADVAGDTGRALALARKAYETDPQVARIAEAYARMLANAGRFDEARKIVDAYEAQGLDHPLIRQVGAAVARHENPGPFADTVQQGAAEMFHGIAVSMARDGNSDLAVVFLRLARYLDPHSDVVTLVLGQVLDQAGQRDAANAIYESIPPGSPMKDTAVVRIALNLDAAGKRDEAIRRVSNILNARPDNLQALATLGDLQRYDKQYRASAETYTRALAIVGGEHPADWRYYYNRGIAYERSDQWPKAETDFLKALKLNPDQPSVLNYLGYSWVDKGMHLKRALAMIEKAVKQVPQDGLVIDSLGWAYYKLGRIQDAVRTLEQAVQLEPNDPEINDHLGDAYWRAGRHLEAKFQWRIASSVDTQGNVRERVAPKLKNGLDTPTADYDGSAGAAAKSDLPAVK